MLYLLAIIFPPAAVLLAGKPGQFLISLVLTALGWIPGIIHALFVANNFYEDQRTDRIIKAEKKNADRVIKATAPR